ncbi:MAG: hypothetical protein ACXQS4_05125 [Methermicoccaceae archaeon]
MSFFEERAQLIREIELMLTLAEKHEVPPRQALVIVMLQNIVGGLVLQDAGSFKFAAEYGVEYRKQFLGEDGKDGKEEDVQRGYL